MVCVNTIMCVCVYKDACCWGGAIKDRIDGQSILLNFRSNRLMDQLGAYLVTHIVTVSHSF